MAAFAFASIAAAPAAAGSGSIFDHGAVNTGVSPLGLNNAAPAAPPAANAAAPASVGAFQHMVGLANVQAPRTPSLEADVARGVDRGDAHGVDPASRAMIRGRRRYLICEIQS